MTFAPPAAPDSHGCDTVAPGLLSLEGALALGLALCRPPTGTETLPLEAATGRVLAAPARAPAPLPRFDAAAMDGYALRLGDLDGAGPWRLPVAGRIAAGMAAPARMPPGAALRIFTGAPTPPDCDAVVMQERVSRSAEAVTLHRRPDPGENIRRTGEDLPAGAAILPAGRLIGPREAAALAAVGMGRVGVRPRLRVAILSTGSELRAPGEPLGPGQIWNANRFQLRAALGAPWVALDDLGAAPDDPATLRAALDRAAAGADLVVTTGGVSVGDEDHLPQLVREAGGEISVLAVAMKPGKPVTLGRLGGAVFVGLPGNPVSAFVTWAVLGAPMAEALAGLVGAGPRRRPVRATAGFDRRPGRCEFRPARLTDPDARGLPGAELLAPSFSHRIALLAGADGLVLIPAAADRIAPGDLLEFLPF